MRWKALVAVSLSAAVALAAVSSSAQRRRPPDRNRPRSASSAAPAPGYALTNRLGPAAALHLLTSPRRDDRLQGVQRLAAQNDFAAAQVLLQAVSDNPSIVADPVVKSAVIRALAPFASRDAVRRIFAAWVVGDRSHVRAPTDSARNLQLQAALALAASGDARALDQLVAFVIAGEDAAQQASTALLAHPPDNIDAFLRGKATTSPGALRLLGQLGDLRALPTLRKALGDNDPSVASEAALGLARLGDDAVLPIARAWLAKNDSSPATRIASANAMVLMRASDAPRAIAILIADPATRAEGLRLAYEAPTPQLTPSLAGFLSIAAGQQRSLAIAALSRSGGPLAVSTLEPLVRKIPVDEDAALALARCTAPQARDSISRLLQAPATRRVGARVGIARFALLHDTVDELETALRSMLASTVPADRETAAFGLTLARWEPVTQFVSSRDLGVLAAACRATYALAQADRATCAAALSESATPELRQAVGVALIDSAVLTTLSTSLLLRWVEEPGSSAAVFARLLAARDSELVRPRLEQLFASGDATLRAQVALGLAASPDASASSLLINAFQTEEDATVRRAIVRALSHRKSVHRNTLLADAARLDPDPGVRSTAGLALRGVSLPIAPQGADLAWLQVRSSDPSAQHQRAAVRITFASGIAITALTDDDGFLMVPGVPADEVRVTVAPQRGNGQPPSP